MNSIDTFNYYLRGFSVSSPFGEVRGNTTHRGVDLNKPGNTDLGLPIYSITNGTVKRIGFEANGAGHFIVIAEGKNESKYFHMKEKTPKKTGDQVVIGEAIGFIGTTGSSTGPHLHLERWENNQVIDPIPWLKKLLALAKAQVGTFKDVAKNAWYFADVEKANKLGIMVGKTKDIFEPNTTVTRAELAVVAVRLYELLKEK